MSVTIKLFAKSSMKKAEPFLVITNSVAVPEIHEIDNETVNNLLCEWNLKQKD